MLFASAVQWALLVCALGLLGVSCDPTLPNAVAKGIALAVRKSTTSGTVVSTQRIRTQEDNIHRFVVSYQVDGRRYRSGCYSSKQPYRCGDRVTVEYAVAHPQCARIRGMGFLAAPASVMSIAGLILLPGLIWCMYGFWRHARTVRLLASGELAWGRLVDRKYLRGGHGTGIHLRLGNRGRWEYTFSFQPPHSEGYEVKARTDCGYERLLEDEREEPLLYDPADPRKAVMLDNIPGWPRLDEKGAWREIGAWRSLVLVILPLVNLWLLIAWIDRVLAVLR